ncbi:hypothetical protein GGR57DRAFT_468430 [Xylariaceae sp. FL1272]|nr:hypothetical protein GGR57DRAFT_468430 [Xylariaceae sp. FL1272]
MSAHLRTKLWRFYVFDGTWANRNAGGNPTILDTAVELLSVPGSRQEIRYFPGVGTRYGMIEKYLGGGLGRGVEEDIIYAIDHLATNYSVEDQIFIAGYSRGAYTARCLVTFLSLLGLPQCDRESLHKLYSKYLSGQLRRRGVADHLRVKYKCRDITIKSLVCIDTVGAMGIPRTGLFSLLNILHPFIKKSEFLGTDVASNVELMFHALALHESRGPFRPTLMHVPENRRDNIKQVYFIGSHSDVARPSANGDLCNIVLAAVLEHWHGIHGIVFNEEKLRICFPHAGATSPLSEATAHDWVFDPIRPSATGFWRLLGRHTRQPGQYFEFGLATNETIHATVRLRGYGMDKGNPAIVGYQVRAEPDQSFTWHRGQDRVSTNSSGGSMEPLTIREEPLGLYEAWLHGVSLEAAE